MRRPCKRYELRCMHMDVSGVKGLYNRILVQRVNCPATDDEPDRGPNVLLGTIGEAA